MQFQGNLPRGDKNRLKVSGWELRTGSHSYDPSESCASIIAFIRTSMLLSRSYMKLVHLQTNDKMETWRRGRRGPKSRLETTTHWNIFMMLLLFVSVRPPPNVSTWATKVTILCVFAGNMEDISKTPPCLVITSTPFHQRDSKLL